MREFQSKGMHIRVYQVKCFQYILASTKILLPMKEASDPIKHGPSSFLALRELTLDEPTTELSITLSNFLTRSILF